MFQTCSICQKEKPLTPVNFHLRKDTNKFRPHCIECHKVRCKTRRKNRTPEQIESDSVRYMNTPPNIRLWTLAKRRAQKKNIDFDLVPGDIRVPEFCPVFPSIKLDSSDIHSCPTLDRIDNSRGYVKGNVRVISHRANTIKGFATADELYRVADYTAGKL